MDNTQNFDNYKRKLIIWQAKSMVQCIYKYIMLTR
jgi:hypothetical protein